VKDIDKMPVTFTLPLSWILLKSVPMFLHLNMFLMMRSCRLLLISAQSNTETYLIKHCLIKQRISLNWYLNWFFRFWECIVTRQLIKLLPACGRALLSSSWLI